MLTMYLVLTHVVDIVQSTPYTWSYLGPMRGEIEGLSNTSKVTEPVTGRVSIWHVTEVCMFPKPWLTIVCCLPPNFSSSIDKRNLNLKIQGVRNRSILFRYMEVNNKKRQLKSLRMDVSEKEVRWEEYRRMLIFGNKSQEIMWVCKLCKNLILMKI